MKKIVLLILVLLLSAVLSGCGGGTGSLVAPIGAKITITPSTTSGPLTITSTSPVLKSVVQVYQIAVKDFDNSTKGVRDTIFDVTFELTNVPGTTLPDINSLVGLCDGTAIINTLARRQTDEDGIYNLCVVYTTGAGLNYTGNLKVLSGQQFVGQEIAVTSTTPDLTVNPAAITIPAGSSAQFTVSGGIPGYVITSSNPAILPVPSVLGSSGSTFLITVPVGTQASANPMSYTITDSTGKTVQASVTIGDPPPVTVFPPSPVSIVAGDTVQFTITGGTPDYTIISGTADIIPTPSVVTSSGGTFTVTIPVTTNAGNVLLSVRDSLGAVNNITLSVKEPEPPQVIPNSMTIIAGSTATFAVVGGVPGYTIVSNNANVPPGRTHLNASGDTFTVPVSSSIDASTVILTVIDLAGNTGTATLNITAAPEPLVVIPSSVPVTFSAIVNPTFNISGGTPGYTVTSSNPADVYFGTPGTASTTTSGSFTVTVNPTSLTPKPFTVFLTINDSAGLSRTVTITVTP